MLAATLLLDMACNSTSIASDLAVPIVTLLIVAVGIVAVFSFRVSSSTCLHDQYCGINRNSAGSTGAGFND
jgi:hypothetical protein